MTSEAASHAWQLISRGQLELVDVAVTLRALDIALEVNSMIELEVRFRDRHALDTILVLASMSDVAERTLSDELARVGAHGAQVAMVAGVAAVAACGRRKQPISAISAGFGLVMAGRAAHAELPDVAIVIEANRQLLRRKDHRARPAVVRARAGRPIVKRHFCATRKLGQPVHGHTPYRIRTADGRRRARRNGALCVSRRGAARGACHERDQAAEHEQPSGKGSRAGHHFRIVRSRVASTR